MPAASKPLVHVRDLQVRIRTETAVIHAVNGVDFDVEQGKVLCIIGESGSGKSVTLRALMGLNPPTRSEVQGTVVVDGADVARSSERTLAEMRGATVSMIFQDPMVALDPVFTIGQQIAEVVTRHKGVDRRTAERRVVELLELVQIPSARRRLDAYPHELSGGLRQRAMIAMALSCEPKLLLADEPTTALDATVQIQILVLLRNIQQELGMGMIFVTHDLGVANEVADRVAVMYGGYFVEEGPVGKTLSQPRHPYTCALMGSTVHGQKRGQRLVAIEGAPPTLKEPLKSCAFAPRCALVQPACLAGVPAARFVEESHRIRCIR
jgi:peptide/nickel transport system ATP-binding protein